ncbi:MAG TPA: hypothetical protein VM943_03160 [Pyrinomonadaceae bacterium]|nr:hypothetical protein [Pyrinomonadaceae bacterium]
MSTSEYNDGVKKEAMRGIQFVTDADGRKTAVIIDLKKHGEIWEDIYDSLIARQRAPETRESLVSVKRRLLRQGKLGG